MAFVLDTLYYYDGHDDFVGIVELSVSLHSSGHVAALCERRYILGGERPPFKVLNKFMHDKDDEIPNYELAKSEAISMWYTLVRHCSYKSLYHLQIDVYRADTPNPVYQPKRGPEFLDLKAAIQQAIRLSKQL